MLEDFNKVIDDINETTEEAKENLRIRKRLVQLQIVEALTRLSSWLAVNVLMLLLCTLVVLFLLIAASLYLGHVLESMPLGFAATAMAFLIIGLVLLRLARNLIREGTSDILIKIMMDE